MTYKMSTSTVADTYTLSQKSGSSTSTGNGMVTNSTSTFICENKISGSLAGAVLCTEATGTSASAPLSAYDDSYIFKMSGDRGAGIGTFYSAQYNYPSHIVRIATRTGKTTGIVEPANSSVFVSSDAGNSLEQARSLNPVRSKDLAKTIEMPNAKNAVQLTEEEQADFQQWIQEAKLLVRQSRLVN